MAIYQNEQDMEKRLDTVFTEQSAAGEEWKSGYETAVDVATCCDENTAWHSNDYPEHDSEVLVCYYSENETHMNVGVYEEYEHTWYIYNCEHYDAVCGWMELPDIPNLKGRIYDESSKT